MAGYTYDQCEEAVIEAYKWIDYFPFSSNDYR